jgi:hypothetical protein
MRVAVSVHQPFEGVCSVIGSDEAPNRLRRVHS